MKKVATFQFDSYPMVVKQMKRRKLTSRTSFTEYIIELIKEDIARNTKIEDRFLDFLQEKECANDYIKNMTCSFHDVFSRHPREWILGAVSQTTQYKWRAIDYEWQRYYLNED
jgi:hypothetical protein